MIGFAPWGFFTCGQRVIWLSSELPIAQYFQLGWENHSLVVILSLLLLVMSSEALLLL